MAIHRTQSGKVDKRTKEYKEMCANLAKARKAAAKKSAPKATKKSTGKVKRTADGTVDLRTKEGKEIAARMEKARKAKRGGLMKRILRLF